MIRRIYPYLIFIIVAFIIWGSGDFWRPDTYFNIGDSLFPFKPAEQMASAFYAWQDNGSEGLGVNQEYLNTIALYYYALMAFLKILGFPLWICNRLFFLIPTLVLLSASYYMISSFVKGKYWRIGAILGSVFLTTAPPLAFITPVSRLAIAGMVLSFAGLNRFIEKQKYYHLITFAAGVLLMTSMPRYIYISVPFMGVFLMCWYVLGEKNEFKNNLKNITKLISIGAVLVVLINLSTFLPTVSFLFKHHSSELLPNKGLFLDKIKMVDSYKNTTSLLYSGRLINYGIGPHYKYFSHYFNLLISFLLLIFLFIHLVICKRISKSILCVLLTSFFILLWIVIFSSDFYKFLIRAIPGFWIINNPMYILITLSLLYSVLLAHSTDSLLYMIGKGSSSIINTKTLSGLVVIGVSFLVIINNGMYFYDKIPHVRRMFGPSEKLMDESLGHQSSYFKIPEEYKTLSDFLPDEDKNARVLVLPFVISGYVQYSWWLRKTMPEILAQITSLRLGGATFKPSDRLETIRKLILSEKFNSAISILKFYNYKYIFIHKDMRFYNYSFEDNLRFYLAKLPDVTGLEMILDNDYFRLYKIKPLQHQLYQSACASGVLVEGGTELMPLLFNTHCLDGRQTVIFSDQQKKGDMKLLEKVDDFAFKDSVWQDLAVELCQRAEVREQKTEIILPEKGVYEIYLSVSEIKKRKIPVFDIKIDGNKIQQVISITTRKHIKIGEAELKEGEHIVEITNIQKLATRKGQSIILADKKERQRTEDMIWNRINQPGSQLCYIFSKDGEFYVPQGGNYIIKAEVSAHPYLVRKKDKIGPEINFGIEELKDWSINSTKVSFDYSIEDGVFVLSAYFKADGRGDELVQMQNKNVRVDLEKYPCFDLTYRIEDPQIQTIELVAGIDFDRDGEVNEYFRGIFPEPASVVWADFSYNLLDNVKSRFPDKEYYDLIFLELYPHKLWEVDCSSAEKRGEYTFWIKGISFYYPSPKEEQFILDDEGGFISYAEFTFHKPIVELDGEKYWLYKEFEDKEDAKQDMCFLRQEKYLEKGKHYLTSIADNSFSVNWVIIEPIRSPQTTAYNKEEPKIVFKRVNPTKYEVEVEGAENPFWLVLSESFQGQWKVYSHTKNFGVGFQSRTIISRVKRGKGEGIHPGDIRYLFKKPLDAEHYLVNGYSNGWFIDPSELNLPEDFTLVLYFLPQSLFYIGLCVSVLAMTGCVVYLGTIIVRKNSE